MVWREKDLVAQIEVELRVDSSGPVVDLGDDPPPRAYPH